MSGFTRDTKMYGDRLVYEVLASKWGRYHAGHCGCDQDWLTAHVIPAGFTVVPGYPGHIALVGPGLTEDVDESQLTANALWEAVTGKPGTQDWYEQVRVICRDPEHEAARKAQNAEIYQARKDRAAKSKQEPLSPAQISYLTTLAQKAGRERFDEQFAIAIKGSKVAPRKARETDAKAIARLTKTTARALITALVGHR